jgi:hypothetical protein
MIVAVSTQGGSTNTTFPKAAIEARLRGDLLKAIAADAFVRGIVLPAGPSAQAGTAIQIDSLVVVSLLVAVEPTLGFKLQDSVVKSGGYTSVNHAIDQLIPRIEKAWDKRVAKGGKP